MQFHKDRFREYINKWQLKSRETFILIMLCSFAPINTPINKTHYNEAHNLINSYSLKNKLVND